MNHAIVNSVWSAEAYGSDAVTPAAEALPGYRPIQQMVFCDFYPAGETQYEELRDAMDRLQLNDSSFTFAPESTGATDYYSLCEEVMERVEARIA